MAFTKYYVREYSELYNYLNEALKRIRARSGESTSDLLRRKLAFSYRAVLSEIEHVYKVLNEISSSGEFYRELFKVYAGVDAPTLASSIKRRAQLARSIYRELTRELNSSSRAEMRDQIRLFRSGLGRLLSLYRRANREVVLIKSFLREVSRMPDVRGDYVVVIAGLPQVGKSTILSKLTSAKPQIGTYPFTTKTLIAGHIIVEPYGRIVLVDSPGVLDSPIDSKNVIERKTLLAIKYLADHILYVLVADPSFYYTLEEQLKVYQLLKGVLGNKPTTIVVNKVDVADEPYLRAVLEEVERATSITPIPISALTGFNLDKLRELLVRSFTGRSQHRSL